MRRDTRDVIECADGKVEWFGSSGSGEDLFTSEFGSARPTDTGRSGKGNSTQGCASVEEASAIDDLAARGSERGELVICAASRSEEGECDRAADDGRCKSGNPRPSGTTEIAAARRKATKDAEEKETSGNEEWVFATCYAEKSADGEGEYDDAQTEQRLLRRSERVDALGNDVTRGDVDEEVGNANDERDQRTADAVKQFA